MFPRIVRTTGSLISKAALHKSVIESSSVSVPLSQRRNHGTDHHRHHHHLHAKKNAPNIASAGQYLKVPLTAATMTPDKDVLTLEFTGETPLQFPVVWLRDSCRCDECYDHLAQSRLIDQTVWRPDSVPTSVRVESDKVKIVWDDSHRSEYSKDWLVAHSFAAEHQEDREIQFHEPRLPWGSSDFKNLFKAFSYERVMNDDETLLKWLIALARHGLAKLEGAPIEGGIVHKLAGRIAFIRSTLYGNEFHVKSVENATNTAYKKGQLQMHSDMPFYHHLPGTILLHCMVQSHKGGDNLLTDGLNAAYKLTKEQYRTLADTVVNWSDIGSDKNHNFHSINREPVICEDKLGNIRKINWSQPQRDLRFDVSIPQAIQWYKAMKEYTDILHHPSNAVQFKMQPGDILTLDNRRVMHSRANYSDGARQLNGAYVDWDEIYPRIRVLRKQLNITE